MKHRMALTAELVARCERNEPDPGPAAGHREYVAGDYAAAADRLLDELLSAGIDAILDDRDERPGSMFADWELIGVPHRIVVGERGLKEGKLEYKGRKDAEAAMIDAAAAVEHVRRLCA